MSAIIPSRVTDGGNELRKSEWLRRWSGPACVASSIGFLIGALASLDFFWALLWPLLHLGFLCWAAALFVTLRERRWWWAIASLPPISIPLYIFGEIVAACARGNCL
jgi:hypothetical protein